MQHVQRKLDRLRGPMDALLISVADFHGLYARKIDIYRRNAIRKIETAILVAILVLTAYFFASSALRILSRIGSDLLQTKDQFNQLQIK